MNNAEKVTKMVHFVIANTQPQDLGATKLNKVLWFADLMYYREHGRSISGEDSYRKLQYGPVLTEMPAVLRTLKQGGFIAEREVQTRAGTRREFIGLKAVDVTEFAADELAVLRTVMRWSAPHSAQALSDLTHDALWKETERGEQIPIAAAAAAPGTPTEDDLRWAEKALSGFEGWDEVRAPA